MIYEFEIPHIVDTKNLITTFLNKKYVTQENVQLLTKVNNERAHFKNFVRNLLSPENNHFSETILNELNNYLECSALLHEIFDHNYPIKKNWKWTPIFTNTSILKFSKNIFEGKSAEIVMARYCYFAFQTKSFQPQLEFIKKNFGYEEKWDVNEHMAFNTQKKADPMVLQLQDNIKTALRGYIDAWKFMSAAYTKSQPQLQILALSDQKYLEIRSVGFEIALNITKINANILQVEFLRLDQKFEEMVKFAKSAAIQGQVVESILYNYSGICDPKLLDFAKIVSRLYKALCLWVLIKGHHHKLKNQNFGPGENFNQIAGLCVSFAEHIGVLIKDINSSQRLRDSPYYRLVNVYCNGLMTPLWKEIMVAYGPSYKYQVYDDSFFNKIPEVDYVTEKNKA